MKIAFVTPLPPLPTGVSDYAAEILPHLATRADLRVFVENPEVINPHLRSQYEVLEAAELPHLVSAGEIDLPIYQLGNSMFHAFQLDLLRRFPGVIVLHDLVLHHLQAGLTIGNGDLEGYRRLLTAEYGEQAADWPERIERAGSDHDARYNIYCRLPLSRNIAASSLGVVCHTHYVRRRLRRWLPDHPLEVIPHGGEIPRESRRASRRRLGLGRRDFVVGILGGLNHNRHAPRALRACAQLVSQEPRLRVMLWDFAGDGVHALVDELQLRQHVVFIGRSSHVRFLSDIAALDVGVVLRYPTVGETSGSVVRLMSLGVPFITSDVDGFRELDDRVCVKLEPGPRLEADLAHALRRWLRNRQSRRAYTKAGLLHAQRELRVDRCAQDLISFCRKVYEPGRTREVDLNINYPKVHAIIVAEDADPRESVVSTPDQDYPQLAVTVVRNGGSIDVPFGDRVRVIESASRLSTGAAVNLAAQNTSSDYVAILGARTLASRSWVRELVAAAECHPRAGVLGGRIVFSQKPTIILSKGLELDPCRYIRDRGRGERDDSSFTPRHDVFGVRPDAMLVRECAFRELGGFDARLPMLFAAVDLCFRMRASGWKIICVPSALVRTHDHPSGHMPHEISINGQVLRYERDQELEDVQDRTSATAGHQITMGTGDVRGLGPGWTHVERNEHGAWRYTRGRAWFYLRSPGHHRWVVVKGHCPLDTRMQLLCDDLELGEHDLQGGPRDYRFRLNEHKLDRVREFCIQVPTFRPCDHGLGTDDRELGIAVSQLRLA